MLISEIKKWHWVITWDNPLPADSSAMIVALSKLGNLTKVRTKTTFVLAPRASVKVAQIRRAITNNLNRTKGNATYVNLKTGNAFECAAPRFKWLKVN